MSGKVPLNRNAEDKGPVALGIVISMSVLSTLFTAGRLFVRGKILNHFYLDDYLIVASVLLTISAPDKTCWDKWILVYFAIYSGGHLGFCAFVDLYLAIYPAIVLSKLQMSVRKKVALSIALGTGSMSGKLGLFIVEGSTMIIAACIPVLQPLGELIFGKRIFTSGGGRCTYENYGSGPNGQHRSDIEMSRSKDVKKRVARRQDDADAISLNDMVTTTMVTKRSQESILKGENMGRSIARTDAISVSIESSKS
ncbi:integral membrane protein [Colletotrichum nymphaeae SA-01]|uniref:Integral membrane protein n=1 Tax=Colletotrichum nymphaeae SA-01 TaxID=1460502 RepID=A0A135T666_9PEZI|nr:integral membrane protein [Colletotrichum nymphaeae SA-01]